MSRKRIFICGVAAATLIMGATSLAATPPTTADPKVQNLAVEIGKATRAAEAKAAGAEAAAAERVVETAVQELIVVAGQPPQVVRDALQRVITVCIRPAEVELAGITCPGSASSFAALRNVLGVVVALLEDNVGAVDGDGDPPIGLPAPLDGGGGSDYRRVP